MADSKVQEANARSPAVAQAHVEAEGEGRPATLADRLASGLSEFFTRRRQSRPGLYAPLVRLERND